jgi:superfamily II DNA helicase RecQ
VLIKIINLPYLASISGFDDRVVKDFVKDKQIDQINHYFYQQEARPHLCFIIQYQPAMDKTPAPVPETQSTKKNNQDWKQQLPKKDWFMYENMRDWRVEQSKAAGIPAYHICTNQTLADIIKSHPTSLGELANVQGMGVKKIEKFGQPLLEALTKLYAKPTEEKSNDESR